MRHWCLARAWENGLSHPAFEGITRMLEGLVAPGLSDFSWPWPFRQSPQTHTYSGLSTGSLPTSTGRAGCTDLSAQASFGSLSRGQLSSSAGHGAPPPLGTASASLLCRHRVRIAVGARTAFLAASAIACESGRCSTYGSCHGSEVPGPSPQASRPGPPSPAPIRACGPARAPRKWASGPEEPGPRAPLPSRSGL